MRIFRIELRLRIRLRPFIDDAINAAVFMVAIRIAQMMLQVPDDGLAPVAEVDRALRADVDRGRSERRIGRRDQLLRDRVALEAGALFADLDAVDPLEADDVAVEEVAPELLGELPAADDGGAATRDGAAGLSGAWRARREFETEGHVG